MTSKIKVDNISDQNDNNIINESGDVITVGAAGDTVAVAGNIVKSNAYQAADGGSIISQSGTTITIGASGDTVSLASGASQSGFGRSGSVNWQTTIKTSGFTAVSGEGYFCNTTGGAFTVTLPASPSAGAIVAIKDYANTADTNNITIGRNSSNINGEASDPKITIEGGSVILVYADSTKGWLVVESAQNSDLTFAKFPTATGGTITTDGNFKVHTFTGPGTFCVSCAGNSDGANQVDYLVIAGGGGGGGAINDHTVGGGGGAGGYRETPGTLTCYTASPANKNASVVTLAAQGYPITVGGGGTAGIAEPGRPNFQQQTPGGNSIFSSTTAAGGGQGANYNPSSGRAGSGGSGGGGSDFDGTAANNGTGNSPPVSPAQGSNGGDATNATPQPAPQGPTVAAGGGGGASAVGGTANPNNAGAGGAGSASGITGSPVTRAGGGGGGANDTAGSGGAGGGGGGGQGNACGSSATVNTGGGGGGASATSGAQNNGAGTGGSGIVIIRYKFQ